MNKICMKVNFTKLKVPTSNIQKYIKVLGIARCWRWVWNAWAVGTHYATSRNLVGPTSIWALGCFWKLGLAEGQSHHKLVARPGLGGPTKPEGVRGNLTEFEPVFLYSGWIALHSQIEWALNTSYQDYLFVMFLLLI
jgi:hypothetical protein